MMADTSSSQSTPTSFNSDSGIDPDNDPSQLHDLLLRQATITGEVESRCHRVLWMLHSLTQPSHQTEDTYSGRASPNNNSFNNINNNNNFHNCYKDNNKNYAQHKKTQLPADFSLFDNQLSNHQSLFPHPPLQTYSPSLTQPLAPAIPASLNNVLRSLNAKLMRNFLERKKEDEDDDGSQTSKKRALPSSYLCHLCFRKGHFIKDCPQVSSRTPLTHILHTIVLHTTALLCHTTLHPCATQRCTIASFYYIPRHFIPQSYNTKSSHHTSGNAYIQSLQKYFQKATTTTHTLSQIRLHK